MNSRAVSSRSSSRRTKAFQSSSPATCGHRSSAARTISKRRRIAMGGSRSTRDIAGAAQPVSRNRSKWRLFLNDDSLLRSLHGLMCAHRRVTAGIVAHLAELDQASAPRESGASKSESKSLAAVQPDANRAVSPGLADRPPIKTLEPLAADRFLLKVTLTRAMRDKLELARDLLRHRQPDGRLDAIVDAARDVLLDELQREKLGRARRPRGQVASMGGANSRTVPRNSRREAIARDGIQCAFISADGRRCTSRAFLEFDHIDPVGKGGGPEPENIRVLCRAHNRFEAERAYGRGYVEAAIDGTHGNRRHPRCRG